MQDAKEEPWPTMRITPDTPGKTKVVRELQHCQVTHQLLDLSDNVAGCMVLV